MHTHLFTFQTKQIFPDNVEPRTQNQKLRHQINWSEFEFQERIYDAVIST